MMIGGFGTAGQPVELIDALIDAGRHATSRSSTTTPATATRGLAALLGAGRVRKIICSFPRQADSWHFDALYRAGEIELELVPQGNLAERIRAAGAGIGAFFTPDRLRHPAGRRQGDARDRRPALRARVPDPRRLRADQGAARRPLGQPRLPQDRAQLRADHGGGRRRQRSRRCTRSCRLGALDPEDVVTPGIFVQRVVRVAPPPAPTGRAGHVTDEQRLPRSTSDEIAARVARDIPEAPTSTSASACRPGRQPPAAGQRDHPAQRERHARHGPGPRRDARTTT